MKPSFVSNRSVGPELKARLPIGPRSGARTDCSVSKGALKAVAVASSAPTTSCPRPERCFSINAMATPKAACRAVPKSTKAIWARQGRPGSPVR